ncbi:MAG: hypothetical protein ACTSRL_14375 [Candidatus Helarchaeota archaeon]|nr:hypothetical protein [Deltaproteobacteria bacterium]
MPKKGKFFESVEEKRKRKRKIFDASGVSRKKLYAAVLAAIIVIPIALYLGLFGLHYQPTPPPAEGYEVVPYLNATTEVQIMNTQAIVTPLTEVQLFMVDDLTNWSTATQIDLSLLAPAPEFIHTGWLNADFFNYNLSTLQGPNESKAFMVRVRPWWLLSEWREGFYSPPSWWLAGQAYDPYVQCSSCLQGLIEENETSPIWVRIGSGVNRINLVTEPYTLYGKIENSVTLQSWNSSNNAYSNNYTDSWTITLNLPTNESQRGYLQTYDWRTGIWYGCWLIASSNNYQNIYRSYNDSVGNAWLQWINMSTFYRGILFNDSIISGTLYDVAILLPTFTMGLSFTAQIQLWNASAGIHWYLGYGYETQIHLITKL